MSKTPTRITFADDEFPDTSKEEITDFVVAGPIFGRNWKVLQSLNFYTAMAASEDVTRFARLISDAIHPDERDEFLTLLQAQKKMTAEQFIGLANKLVEAASGGNPTSSSTDSSAGTPKKVVARRSVAR